MITSGQYGNVTWVTDADTGTSIALDTVPAAGWANVFHLTKWDLDRGVKSSKYLSTSTGGNERTISGGKTASGSMETVVDANAPDMALLNPGDRVRLRLYTAPLVGHEVTVRLLTCKESVTIEEGKEIRRTFTWEQDDRSPIWNGVLAASPVIV